ncbi:hypothetical protein F4823DRAFT_592760 [Ustulina deusta]|nr:hypothetical protein F4823DRAFT_592760 [Ustulina deusta]
MYEEPTEDELEGLLRECETALSTVRRTMNACPSDLVAKVALPPLESSLRHLAHDIQGWMGGGHDADRRPLLSSEHFDRLCRFVRQSRLSIIDPQATKIGLRVPGPKPAGRTNGPSLYSILYIFALFFAQGLAVVALDRFQTSPAWVGNLWVPHLASLLATYVLVLHHQTSWVPTLCYIVAQGLCVRVTALLDLWRILGLFLVLANIVAGSPPPVGMKDVEL